MESHEIKQLIKEKNNRGGIMYNEKYLKNHYAEIYDIVINFSFENNLNLLFKQKVYHYLHDIKVDNIKCINPNCNNFVKFKDSTIGYYKYCSNKCVGLDPKIIKQKEDKSFEKFGTRTPAESDIVKKKMIKTNLEKYGTEYPFSIRKNSKKLLNEYDVENVSQIDFVKEKVKKTKFEKYGDGGYNNIEKTKITNLEKYGVEYSFQSEKVKRKIKNKFLEKYGVEYPAQNDIIKIKMKETMLNLYNCENPSQSDYIQMIKRFNKTNKTLKRYENLNIINVDYINKIFNFKCENEHIYDISFEIFQNRKRINTTICTKCNPINSSNISGKQLQLQQFIKNNYNGDIIYNDRKILKPFELDVYLPELKIALEFNGVHWHSEEYVESNYHLNKTELCEKQGIKLIQIYEDDWLYKQDIIKSRILNILNLNTNKIFARKTEIKEIFDNDILRKFLEINHIQGFIGSQVKLGLFYNDELVSLMTFGKQRKNMGIKGLPDTYEMLRFCNKLNSSVIGGASKLFKYFINNYKPKEIITYADRSWSQGELYNNLGFGFVYKTQPNYFYVIDGIRKNRFNFRKDVLIKDGFDPNKTEHDIMLERKIYRIYDSGQLKFIWKKVL